MPLPNRPPDVGDSIVTTTGRFSDGRYRRFHCKQRPWHLVRMTQVSTHKISGSVEIDPPQVSDKHITESNNNQLYPVSDGSYGWGFPYAPENFPNPGDKWSWRVGKRVSVSKHYVDRYLYPPNHFRKEGMPHCFRSKESVQQFVLKAFPSSDINAFFASFSWKIPAGNNKGNKEPDLPLGNSNSKLHAAGCKVGNIACSRFLAAPVMLCDICCTEPGFCGDCCCILCAGTVDSENGGGGFIRCEATNENRFTCGHVAHLECGVRCSMAGTLGGSVGLDAEYFCRRCNGKTDLVPHIMELFQSCESVPCVDERRKILDICLIILWGSTKTSAKILLHHVELALGKLKDEIPLEEDTRKKEDASAVTTGELSQHETYTLPVSKRRKTAKSRCDIERSEMEQKIKKTLVALRKSQEDEYQLAKDKLNAQKNHVLYLYAELEKEKVRHGELAKFTAMEKAANGFRKTCTDVLKRHFGLQKDSGFMGL